MLVRERTRSWGKQSEPSAAATGKEDMSIVLELMGLFYDTILGKKDGSHFERTYTG